MSKEIELIIHIGTHKTGTTSIQEYLKSHKCELDSADDIHFLEFNISQKFDIPLVTDNDPKLVHQIRTYLKENAVPGKVNLISHEGFFGNPREYYSNYKTTARILFDATTQFNKRIKVFFRRQDQFIQSCYLQLKSRGYRYSFSEFYDREKAKHLNWLTMANHYSNLFGSDQFEVQLYDPKQFTDKSLLQLFGEMIGAGSMTHTENRYLENVGLSNQAVEVFEKISRFLTEREKKYLKSVFHKHFNRGTGTQYHLLDAEETAYIYNYFLESNQKLSDQFCDGQSFSDLDYSLDEPKHHHKYKIYLQIVEELMNKESELSSSKKAILKSYLSTTKSSLLKNLHR